MVKIFSSNFVENEKNFSGLILFSVAKKIIAAKTKPPLLLPLNIAEFGFDPANTKFLHEDARNDCPVLMK